LPRNPKLVQDQAFQHRSLCIAGILTRVGVAHGEQHVVHFLEAQEDLFCQLGGEGLQADLAVGATHDPFERCKEEARALRPAVEATVFQVKHALKRGKVRVRGLFRTTAVVLCSALAVNLRRIYRYEYG
jgi:hypothetical protein